MNKKTFVLILLASFFASINISQAYVLGDINDDGSVNLADVISASQILSGTSPPQAVNILADVNGDSKIGLEEAIYDLQVLAQLKPVVNMALLSGTTEMAELEWVWNNGLPAGGVYSICFYQLNWEPANGCNTNADPYCNCDAASGELTDDRPFSFWVEPGKAYIIGAAYGGGQYFAALTKTIGEDTVQDVNIDTETAMNLVSVLEREYNGVDPGDLSPIADRVDSLVDKATQAVNELNLFYSDRNTHRNADRTTEAVRNFTLDRANQDMPVYVDELDHARIRAYGGGLYLPFDWDYLSQYPMPPLNPHFTFTRINDGIGDYSIGMSDLETVRWDYLVTEGGISQHITTGGSKLVYATGNANDQEQLSTQDGNFVHGIYIRELGSPVAPALLTPYTIHANFPVLSPDESRIAFAGVGSVDTSWSNVNEHAPHNIYVMDADGSNLTQLTFDTEFPYDPPAQLWAEFGNLHPSWSPDGNTIVFSRFSAEPSPQDPFKDVMISKIETLEISQDGEGNYSASNRQTLTNFWVHGFFLSFYPSYSPDGSQLIFSGLWSGDPDNDYEIYSIDPATFANTGQFRYYTNNTTYELQPSFSYDGRFIIYTFSNPGSGELSLKVINRYTGLEVVDLGNFANGTGYRAPRFTGTDVALVAVEEATTDEQGTVIITGEDERTNTSSSTSSNNYYREIIPAANSMGMNFNVGSWY